MAFRSDLICFIWERLQNKTHTEIVDRLRADLEREQNIFILPVRCRPDSYRWIKNLLVGYACC